LASSTVQALEPRRLCAADLVPTGINGTTDVVGAALPIAGQFVLQNPGDAPTPGPVAYRVVLSTSSGLDQDVTVLGNYTTASAIPAGGDALINIDAPTPSGLEGQSRFLGVIVDPDNAVAEADETNNRSINSSVITIAQALAGSSVQGTTGNDVIRVSQVDDAVIIRGAGNTPLMRAAAGLTSLFVDGLAGNDSITADAGVSVRLAMTGSGGNDTIVGGDGDDELSGGTGRDLVRGGSGVNDGDDYLLGGPQTDKLFAGPGNDTLSGAGGNDILYSPSGNALLIGGTGNDRFNTANNATDTLRGNAGTDLADADDFDVLSGIE
jgi:Ca2+-binding RTX toxin-like protein